MSAEIPYLPFDGEIRNQRRELWSETGLLLTRCEVLLGDEWVDVQVHDFGMSVCAFADGTRIIKNADGSITTLHANGDMTCVRDDGSIDFYDATSLENDASGLEQKIIDLRENGGGIIELPPEELK